MYEFKIEGDKISLYNIISSCSCFKEYSFSLSGDKIEIGNFYHDNSAGEIETFERL
jgi:hypothetical protein